MRTRTRMLSLVATAAVTMGFGLAGAVGASAGSPWTDFGRGTGIQQVTYNSGFSSYMSRSGSGIVEQWVAPTAPGDHGAYYLYKPLSGTSGSTAVATPFKQSCDSLGRTAVLGVWTYNPANYTPAGVLSAYFPFPGLTYYVCQYSMSNYATGDLTYTLGSPTVRHVTFDVQMAAPGYPATGWMNYSDTDGNSYSIAVTAVYINGSTATFSGPYPAGSTTQWLVLQTSNTGGVLTWAGAVVTSDPSATLSSFVPTLFGSDVAGSLTIYTK